MSGFKLTIVTPDGLVYDDMAENVIVRTSDGYEGILKDHAPFAAPLAAGEARIKVNSEWRTAACIGGVVNADCDGVKIAANTFEWAEDIDVQRAERARDAAESICSSSTDEREIDIARAKLLRAITRINVASK